MTKRLHALGPTEKPIFVTEAKIKPSCPEYGSLRVYRSGKRKLANGLTVQKIVCKDCSTCFSETSLNKPKPKHENDAHGEIILMFPLNSGFPVSLPH